MMLASCRSAWRARTAAVFFVAMHVATRPQAFAQGPATAPARPAIPKQRAIAAEFPPELVDWKPRPGNPVFAGEGPGHWDAKIRERGWILRDGDAYRLWYTGYDGTHEGIRQLGYATSPDGLHWTRSPNNPLVAVHWVEDMTVVELNDIYYMFAEGKDDNHAEMLTSKDGIDWMG